MEFFTRKETAAMLGIHINYLDRLRSQGKIAYYQRLPGKMVQFSREQINAYQKAPHRGRGRPKNEIIHTTRDS
jgi:excisionase family DNA binding protein